jgi:hypothetical protein
LGKNPCCSKAKIAGNVFFLAKSPEAPSTTMTVASVKRLPDVDMDGIEPRLDWGWTGDILVRTSVGAMSGEGKGG